MFYEILPETVQNRIYCEFYFSKFLSVFKDTFKIITPQGYLYSWTDQAYRDFMIQILRQMDYRHLNANTIIFDELDDINEVIFIESGTVEIGYQMNKRRHFVLRFVNKTLIGAYNCTFNMRIIFCYKAKNECEGYSIRKHKWMRILQDFQEIGDQVRKNI